MTTDRRITFFHAPNTRSSGVLVLLDELQAEHDLHLLRFATGEQRGSEYLDLNPMGKVPAIRHGDAMITEQAAVYMYLAELYPEKGLAPMPGDPRRGPYLRWMVFYGSCVEPAVVDKSLGREGAERSRSPYGDYDSVMWTLERHLSRDAGPWWLGESFTAADALWGNAMHFLTHFKLVPETPSVKAYVERFRARESFARAQARDAALAKQLAA
ncbi:glutathione S-transferase family protein [Pandoraea fibrosis]|uniref:Glutathione S-transferase n=1 Tax=Pandoraea fibrosis TaxID=1891094 RepID=A0A5E4REK4_9BURK|nr:glutathione S-transferase family protein [Pandoraea fibrosis]QHE92918.1 glutathione S-transferase [Pandoraea fibrosis]QHF13525.1 glutathione S-transferase [Pandoraea fibrosis]VVD61730.1 glutathione S-transferase [Pandoraea fibrosis]